MVQHRRTKLATIAACLTATTVLWPIPYAELALLGDPPYASWLVAATVAGLLAGLLVPENTTHAVLAVLFGFAASVPVRALFEITAGSDFHTLWPPEALVAAAVGILGGLIGVGLARAGRRWWPTVH